MNAHDSALMRLTLAFVWLSTGMISLFVFPIPESMALLAQVGLHGMAASVALYGSALLDVLFGVFTLLRPSLWLWRFQALLIITYSIIIALYMPELYLHPFGPMLKNLPILLLLWILYKQYKLRS